MTGAELSRLIGRRAMWRRNGVAVPVVIRDARSNYGRVDVLVEPLRGAGRTWVELRRVEVEDARDSRRDLRAGPDGPAGRD